MDFTNFKIEDNFSAIAVDGEHRDLHNNFIFRSLDYDISRRKLTLYWQRRNESWVSSFDPEHLKLVFIAVSLLKVQERDAGAPDSEDDCLASLGFIGNELIEEVEGYAYRMPSKDSNHLNICFMSGFSLKIAAEKASCVQAW